MSLSGSVLLVDDDAAVLAGHATTLAQHPDLRVFTARSGPEALDAARIHRPDVVISDLRMPEMDGIALCQAIRAEPRLEGTLFVFLTGIQEPLAEIDGTVEFDDLLIKPVTAAELVSKMRAMLRLKRLHDQLRADKLEMERLHRILGQRFDQVLDLMVRLVDLSVPGAAARSVDTTRLTAQLAERFEIPEVLRKDLEVASRVHELGKLLLQGERLGGEEGPEDLREGDQWRYAVAARNLLEQATGLEGAAELIGAIFENWDGTGHPDRLRQGQIPLRSRILRLVIDYQAALAAVQDPVAAIDQLQHHVGTRYDPLAVAYLDALVRASTSTPDWQSTRVHVAIAALAEGMVLADDLFTASGVKLLAKGATISGPMLDTILRRHRSDPMVHGAWVERTSLPVS